MRLMQQQLLELSDALEESVSQQREMMLELEELRAKQTKSTSEVKPISQDREAEFILTLTLDHQF